MTTGITVLTGDLTKMPAFLDSNNNVEYSLLLKNINDKLDNKRIEMNALIGKRLTLTHTGTIHCSHCGKVTKKSFQGFCYDHFTKLAQADSCMMSPERCHFDQGTCREPGWAEKQCFQGHYVYLSNASGIKVGITRGTQVPTRWIDQGAGQAIPIVRVGNRKLSGLVEVILKEHVADKTNWRGMLKAVVEKIDLNAEQARLYELVKDQVLELQAEYGSQNVEWIFHANIQEINYPTSNWPAKISSFNLDKDPEVTGILMGIKGQYLILDTGVINIRRFTGYEVSVAF
jgi:hypothetical protein